MPRYRLTVETTERLGAHPDDRGARDTDDLPADTEIWLDDPPDQDPG